MDARGRPIFKGRFLASFPESSEERYGHNLAGQTSDHEYYDGYEEDRVELEDKRIEIQVDLRERRYATSRDHSKRIQRRSSSRHFFSNLVGSSENSLKNIAHAARPTGGWGGPLRDELTDTDVMTMTKKFQGLRPPSFDGSANSAVAINWLKKINRRLDVLGIIDGA